MRDILCWLKENWRIIVTSGLTVFIIARIIKAIKIIPEMFRVRKTIRYIQKKIDKYRESPEDQAGFVIFPRHLISELNEAPEIIKAALIKLQRKKILKITPDMYYVLYYEEEENIKEK